MKIKINVLVIMIVLTIIVFGISTYMQKKLIKYEPKVSCLILVEDILENERVIEEKFKKVEMPISIIANQNVVTDFKEIEGLYAKDNIKKSQIAIRGQFDTKENLSIYEAETGKEKISIKVKSSENGVSFQIQENSYINVYVTFRNDLGQNFLLEKERMVIGDEFEGYTVVKLLEDVKVLGVFNSDGIEYIKDSNENIDSVLISVTSEEAKTINLLRDIATFNITGVNKLETYEITNISGEVQSQTESGDV